MNTNNVDITAVDSQAALKQFLAFPYDLYRNEPHWVAPLRFERAAQINPAKNPGLDGLTIQHFLARRGGEIVGRISAIKNQNHLDIYQDGAGHFGYFDAVNDEVVKTALLKRVEDWLLEQGLTKMVGPFNASINEEMGVLIDGFDTPPVLMMPFGRPDYQTTFESNGFTKAVDVFAYWTDMHAGYPRPKIDTTMTNYVKNDPDIVLRPMRMNGFMDEVKLAMSIFNDAWSENWGFIPFSDAQIKHMANELKPLIIKDFFWVCEYKGKPAAFILMVPNINEAIDDLDGKLLPFGWAKLIHRLKIKGLKTARIPLMGVRKEYQRSRAGLAMAASLSEKVFEMGRKRGFTHVEMSWILEDNKSMIRIIEQAQGVAYKTYRMYEKTIA
ncbi:MAG TPA: hypothetical protein ENJ42_03805 [Hellea balneolensis]|uniref:N-acetyltransferase domain-containing protein n=1 Tax=Hellea balneolensis TaxID=287478 RepID=A0A7C5QVU0_9PROT|nr:hypothetical protein [Hellea balneolensis]